MCQPVNCNQCGKITWAGCGQHVDQVKASVPAAQWCPGHSAGGSADGGWLGGLFNR